MTRRTAFLERLLERMRGAVVAPRAPRPVRLGVAAVAIGALAAARQALFAGAAPWFLFTPGVVAVALFAGGDAGLLATALATLAGSVASGLIGGTGAVPTATWIAFALFALTGAVLVGTMVALRRALLTADDAAARLADAVAVGAGREAFLNSVLQSSTDCIKVLDLDGRLRFMNEGGQRVMEVSDFNGIAGCPWPDFWSGGLNGEAVEALDAARAGRPSSFVGQASTMRGTAKWWHVAVSPIRRADGAPDRILSISRDITTMREREEERDRFARLTENSTDFIGMAGLDGRLFYLNAAARRMVGLDGAVDIERLLIADFFPPEQQSIVRDTVLPTVDRHGHWAGELSFRHFGTGAAIPVLYSAFPITDGAGRTVGYGTVTRDYRAQKQAEDDLRFLNDELAHRLRNVLSVVQSIAQQTLRRATDPASASRDLSARLVALSAATDVLTGGAWRSAELGALAERALLPHGALGARILVDGPPVRLKPNVAVAMTLALHELATNAAKYGALSTPGGVVQVEWRIEGEGPAAALRFAWRERGGPAVTPPTRQGFGTTLIERSLRSYFGGTAVTDYRPDGLLFTLAAPLGHAAVSAED